MRSQRLGQGSIAAGGTEPGVDVPRSPSFWYLGWPMALSRLAIAWPWSQPGEIRSHPTYPLPALAAGQLPHHRIGGPAHAKSSTASG